VFLLCTNTEFNEAKGAHDVACQTQKHRSESCTGIVLLWALGALGRKENICNYFKNFSFHSGVEYNKMV
jgi:hypothetical protein